MTMTLMTEEEIRKEKKRIRDRNYRFRKMTPAQKRVRIAKDVLERLETKQFVARNGVYLEFGHRSHEVADALFRFKQAERAGAVPAPKDVSLVEAPLHRELEKGCDVCAIGACFSAMVCRIDGVAVKDMLPVEDWGSGNVNNDIPMRAKLREFFEPKQLSMIEAAFEVTGAYAGKEGLLCGEEAIQRAVEFGRNAADQYGDRDTQRVRARVRLTAIMQNIVDNRGEFRP